MPQPLTYKAIVAMASNRVIGKDGGLPWRLKEDLRFFKQTTLGHAILMGRKTWESLGRPLPGRRNLVLSRTLDSAPGAEILREPEEIEALGIETAVYVIGGAEIFRLYLPRCQDLYLTYVFAPYEGDTWLPPFEESFEFVDTLETHPEFVIRHYRKLE